MKPDDLFAACDRAVEEAAHRAECIERHAAAERRADREGAAYERLPEWEEGER